MAKTRLAPGRTAPRLIIVCHSGHNTSSSVSQYNLQHAPDDMRFKVLWRWGPAAACCQGDLHRLQDHFRRRAAQDVAADFDGLGALGDVAQGDVRHSENAA